MLKIRISNGFRSAAHKLIINKNILSKPMYILSDGFLLSNSKDVTEVEKLLNRNYIPFNI